MFSARHLFPLVFDLVSVVLGVVATRRQGEFVEGGATEVGGRHGFTGLMPLRRRAWIAIAHG